MGTREERRAAFETAMKGALELRPLYAAMDEDDQIEVMMRYGQRKQSLTELFTSPLNRLFDSGDELRALGHQSAEE